MRHRQKLVPGSEVQVVDYGEILAIVPTRKNSIQASAGMLAGDGKPLTQALLDEHRRELEGER